MNWCIRACVCVCVCVCKISWRSVTLHFVMIKADGEDVLLVCVCGWVQEQLVCVNPCEMLCAFLVGLRVI